MEAYDPLTAPDPDTWQAIGEAERIGLVIAHHRAAGAELPNERLHATIHVVIENQVAMGEEIPARATLARLMREGPKHKRLDRHDAIHAVGSVLAGFLHELLGGAREIHRGEMAQQLSLAARPCRAPAFRRNGRSTRKRLEQA